jgi:hypothetical protein
MPDLVKGLGDVKEGCKTVLSGNNCVVNSADETMNLFNCRVFWSEAEQMSG